jgi:hypothetical protein
VICIMIGKACLVIMTFTLTLTGKKIENCFMWGWR